MKLPKTKTDNIVVQNLNDEVLIYDLQSNKAVCLNSTTALVYQHCDGDTTFAELKQAHGFSEELIYLALDKLDENKLLANYRAGEHFAGLSRREVIKRVGLGTMIALPMVSVLVAPSAAQAASGPGLNAATFTPASRAENQTCFDNTDCSLFNGTQPGCCTANNAAVSPTNPRVCRAGSAGFNCN